MANDVTLKIQTVCSFLMAVVCSLCFLGSVHTIGEKEASTVYQLNGSTVRLILPPTAPHGELLGRPGVFLTRPHAGNMSFVDTLPNQVRVFDRSVIIDPMDDKVNGTQYAFATMRDATSVYATNWTTALLGSES